MRQLTSKASCCPCKPLCAPPWGKLGGKRPAIVSMGPCGRRRRDSKPTSQQTMKKQIFESREKKLRRSPFSPRPDTRFTDDLWLRQKYQYVCKAASGPRRLFYSRIKAGGRFAPLLPTTPPRRAGRGFFLGSRFFTLIAVLGGQKWRKQKENRMIPPFCKVDLAGGFREFWRGSARGSFFTPWDHSGGLFSLCSYCHPNFSGIQAGI